MLATDNNVPKCQAHYALRRRGEPLDQHVLDDLPGKGYTGHLHASGIQ